MKKQLTLVLENVRSMHNVGALFRTADAFGVSCIMLGGYTPAPIDRFGRVVKDIQKTSLGAIEMVPWEHVPDACAEVRRLKEAGHMVVVLEQDARSVSLSEAVVSGDTVLVLGNEVDGVSLPMRELADMIIEIPMQGKKESLNVSVAGGIALFALTR